MTNTRTPPTLDVIIPCYNASQTVWRALESTLAQAYVQSIYLVNDGSDDDTWATLQTLQAIHNSQDKPIVLLDMPSNVGAAAARNWGALHSQADLVAFLDADDAYQPHALDPIPTIFEALPALGLLRLKLVAVDLPNKFTQHNDFARAWDDVQMTVGGNTVFRRNLLLACGGFPTNALFRQFGGEDSALGIAFAHFGMLGTLFDDKHAGVLHYHHDGMHAERLLNAHLFNQHDTRITPSDIAQANAVTQAIVQRIHALRPVVNHTEVGRREIMVTYAHE